MVNIPSGSFPGRVCGAMVAPVCGYHARTPFPCVAFGKSFRRRTCAEMFPRNPCVHKAYPSDGCFVPLAAMLSPENLCLYPKGPSQIQVLTDHTDPTVRRDESATLGLVTWRDLAHLDRLQESRSFQVHVSVDTLHSVISKCPCSPR